MIQSEHYSNIVSLALLVNDNSYIHKYRSYLINSILYGGFMTKQEKCSQTQKGRIVIHKGDKELRVYPCELQNYYDDGWTNGFSEKRKKKLVESNKKSYVKRIAIHKNNIQKFILEED